MVLFIPYKIDIPMKNPKIIAEIGCNHKGDMLIAKELIRSDVIENFSLLKNIIPLILILRILMAILMVNIVNFLNLRLTNTANCKSGVMNMVLNTLPQYGMLHQRRKSVL